MQEKKRRKRLYLWIVALMIITSVSTVEGYTEGAFWSRIGDTLVVTNTTDNVNIGKNDTTTYKLYVNGSAYFEEYLLENITNVDTTGKTNNDFIKWSDGLNSWIDIDLFGSENIFTELQNFNSNIELGSGSGDSYLAFDGYPNDFIAYWDTSENDYILGYNNGNVKIKNEFNVVGKSNFYDTIEILPDANFTWYCSTPPLQDSWIGLRMIDEPVVNMPVLTGNWGGVINLVAISSSLYIMEDTTTTASIKFTENDLGNPITLASYYNDTMSLNMFGGANYTNFRSDIGDSITIDMSYEGGLYETGLSVKQIDQNASAMQIFNNNDGNPTSIFEMYSSDNRNFNMGTTRNSGDLIIYTEGYLNPRLKIDSNGTVIAYNNMSVYNSFNASEFIFPISSPVSPVNGSAWFNGTTGELGIYSEQNSQWYWK